MAVTSIIIELWIVGRNFLEKGKKHKKIVSKNVTQDRYLISNPTLKSPVYSQTMYCTFTKSCPFLYSHSLCIDGQNFSEYIQHSRIYQYFYVSNKLPLLYFSIGSCAEKVKLTNYRNTHGNVCTGCLRNYRKSIL